ncbi:MAG: hypothetical protein LBD07_02040 [Spirochaetaceae bacterium]|jgi:hypothetical protein|nr:hypothetical protein [Spirochaetaceae bacterium]
MKKQGLLMCALAAALAAAALSGCGTMAGAQSSETIIKSQKDSVDFELFDSSGNLVAAGRTPQSVQLKSGSGFVPAKYTIKYKKTGSEGTHSFSAEGNTTAIIQDALCLLVGVGVVFYVIDAATGALYKVPESITIQDIAYHPGEITILSMDDIKPEMRRYLIPVSR